MILIARRDERGQIFMLCGMWFTSVGTTRSQVDEGCTSPHKERLIPTKSFAEQEKGGNGDVKTWDRRILARSVQICLKLGARLGLDRDRRQIWREISWLRASPLPNPTNERPPVANLTLRAANQTWLLHPSSSSSCRFRLGRNIYLLLVTSCSFSWRYPFLTSVLSFYPGTMLGTCNARTWGKHHHRANNKNRQRQRF
jgi:hypothetical protein